MPWLARKSADCSIRSETSNAFDEVMLWVAPYAPVGRKPPVGTKIELSAGWRVESISAVTGHPRDAERSLEGQNAR
jgi:hypothetical protein